jgi:galactokinase/mevalonate kinase-like predicted kinase
VYIEASAPTRIDLAGGTLDIWPLYLFDNWDVIKRHIDGDKTVRASFERIRDIATAMRAALETGDWPEVGRQVAEEWNNRKRLAPGVTTPEIDSLLASAAAAGRTAARCAAPAAAGACSASAIRPTFRLSAEHSPTAARVCSISKSNGKACGL